MSLDKILPKVQKPTRYTGGEFGEIIKNKEKIDVRFAFCFPDAYEIGMSHLGMRILYGLINSRENYWCERCFAPWTDMGEKMKEYGIPLFALESKDPLSEFDFLGFTLQYELSYTNILYMLELAGIPFYAAQRGEDYPVIIAGGPCAVNPEPLAPFFDLFVIGEGEEATLELLGLYASGKGKLSKSEFLKKAAEIKGVYIPALFEVIYNDNGTIKGRTPDAKIEKRVITDLDRVFFPEDLIVPFGEIVHDRVTLEIFRGCTRGCRFCQAGIIYRPVREKSAGTLNKNARELCSATGYDEISLASLSSSDYSELTELLERLFEWTEDEKISIALPSMRVDNFSPELMKRLQSVRKTGLTFAPEAGTQRLRDVINKNVTEEELMRTCKTAFEGGSAAVKLYFMMGLPTETDEDITGIFELCLRVIDQYYKTENRAKGKGINVSASVACFVPKAFTAFQWEPQDTLEVFEQKQELLKSAPRSKKIKLSYHDKKTSFVEAVFARGDRRLAQAIETAYKKGCRFDGWGEGFSFEKWIASFEECGVDAAFYANRRRPYDEILPWDFIDIGVSKEFLLKEAKKAGEEKTTPNCKEKCSGCGANKLTGGKCVADGKADI